MLARPKLQRRVTLALLAMLGVLCGQAHPATIAGGGQHLCAVGPGGTVFCWGSDSEGQLGNGPSLGNSTRPLQVFEATGEPLVGIVHVAAVGNSTCVVRNDGKALCWGDNGLGQLGNGLAPGDIQTPTVVRNPQGNADLGGIVRLAMGFSGYSTAYSTCAADDTGHAYCWGANRSGALGVGLNENVLASSNLPMPVVGKGADPLLENIRDIAVGLEHGCALAFDGSVACWGSDQWGALGNGPAWSSNRPAPLLDPTGQQAIANIEAIRLGALTGCALDSTGGAWCWGINDHGQLGNDSAGDHSQLPVSVTLDAGGALEPLAQLSTGSAGHHCAIAVSGKVFCWGSNSTGQAGDASFLDSPSAFEIPNLAVPPADARIATMAGATCLRTSTTLHCWGAGSIAGTHEAKMTATPQIVLSDGLHPLDGVRSMTQGSSHACALRDPGEVRCWGSNYQGQLGFEASRVFPYPMLVDLPGNALVPTHVAAGASHTCAATRESIPPNQSSVALYCWGNNLYGQLGIGITGSTYPTPSLVVDSQSPPSIDTALAYRSLSGSQASTCAVDIYGSPLCWGYGSSGQLGIGSNAMVNTPQLVLDAAEYDSASLSTDLYAATSTCGIHTDGAVQCWGAINNSNFPKPITLPNNGGPFHARSLSCDANHCCAIKFDDSLVCWGANSLGQSGPGPAFSPVPPFDASGGPETRAKFVATAAGSSCAVNEADDVYCWGYNANLQLGRITPPTGANPPKIVEGLDLTGIAGISGAGGTMCVWSDAGTARCWGEGSYGQLGNGGQLNSAAPRAAPGFPIGTAPASVRIRSEFMSVFENSGAPAQMVFELSRPSDVAIEVAYSLSGNAVLGADYQTANGQLAGTVVFPAGWTRRSIDLAMLDNTLADANRDIEVSLDGVNVGDAAVDPEHATGMVTIVNDDNAAGLPVLLVEDMAVEEGDSGHAVVNFTLKRSATGVASFVGVSVEPLAGGDAATPGSDYLTQPSLGTVSFPTAASSNTVGITISGDHLPEKDERFLVRLFNPSNALVGKIDGVATIIDDDINASTRAFWVEDAAIAETDGTLAFQVHRSFSDTASTVLAQTMELTGAQAAAAGVDFEDRSVLFPVAFAAGQEVANVEVDVYGDDETEFDEVFALRLREPSEGIIIDAEGLTTIRDDDHVFDIEDLTVAEGSSGDHVVNLTVKRSSTVGAASVFVKTIVSQGLPNPATPVSDFKPLSDTLNFPAGVAVVPLAVVVAGDAEYEPDESFAVELWSPSQGSLGKSIAQVTLINDDDVYAVDDITKLEGTGGATAFDFTLHRSSKNAVASIHAEVEKVVGANNAADAPQDFQTTLYYANSQQPVVNGNVQFPVGQSEVIVRVVVVADAVSEPDEVFHLRLSQPSRGVVGKAIGLGTIINDDVSDDDIFASGFEG